MKGNISQSFKEQAKAVVCVVCDGRGIIRVDDGEPVNCRTCLGVGSVSWQPSALSRQEGGDHYKDMAIQPVEFLVANRLEFIEGCVIKYVCRWRQKGGVQDLKKALHFLEMLIELEERKKPS